MNTGSRHMLYRIRVGVIPAFIIAYFLIVAVPSLLNVDDEHYLLFSWFVFSQVPSHNSETYEIEVISIDGNPLSPPQNIETAGVLLSDDQHPRPYYVAIINLFGIFLSEDSPETARIQSEFEQLIQIRPLVYRIARITYNPIERFQNGNVLSRVVLREYTVQ